MAEVAEPNFSNFNLSDLAAGTTDVYELAGGVIPETAERLDVPLGVEPNSEDLGTLVGRLGKNKVLRDNEEVTAIDRETAVDLVEQSGVQEQLHRSLWTPDIPADNLDYVVMTGAVANWMDRTVAHIGDVVPRGTGVIVATGSRVMDTGTEQKNPYVVDFEKQHDRYPTETEYAQRYLAPRLDVTKDFVMMASYDATAGGEIASQLFRDYPFLFEKKVGFARVANAGVQLAVQMRTAAREIKPDFGFDSDLDHPQVFVLTDTAPLARTEAEEAQPAQYQKAITALRQVALTAKMLHEAAGGE